MYRIVSLMLLFAFVVSTPAQVGTAATSLSKDNKSSGKSAPAGRKNGAGAVAASNATQPIDTAYTESIVKNTTDKMFLTEFVDHLPASAKVPTPEKVLGYPIGTPNKLTYVKDQHRYYRELEKATPRVRTFVAPEKSEQGRELHQQSARAGLGRVDRA